MEPEQRLISLGLVLRIAEGRESSKTNLSHADKHRNEKSLICDAFSSATLWTTSSFFFRSRKS